MKNILFPTDFSKNANNALNYALTIAKDFGATLHIINTYQLPNSRAVPTTQKLLVALKESAITELQDYVKQINIKEEYKNIIINYQAYEGNLINVISDLETEINFDLIVLGTKGASGIKEVLIGSNAEQVVYHAKTPVYVIPENAPVFTFNKTALAVDLNPINDYSIFDTLLSMCKKYNSSIQLVTVSLNDDNNKENPTGLEKIKSFFTGLTISLKNVKNNNVLAGLDGYVEQENPSTLVVISRKHTFFETLFSKTLTDKLACRSKIPIFVVKEK
jgi:nucleotide-binding universal stress UspA family protein